MPNTSSDVLQMSVSDALSALYSYHIVVWSLFLLLTPNFWHFVCYVIFSQKLISQSILKKEGQFFLVWKVNLSCSAFLVYHWDKQDLLMNIYRLVVCKDLPTTFYSHCNFLKHIMVLYLLLLSDSENCFHMLSFRLSLQS